MYSLEEYKQWYKQEYNCQPSAKCLEEFEKLNPSTAPPVETDIPESFWRESEIDG